MSTEIISQDNDFTIVKLDRSFGGARTEVFKIDGTTGAVTGADGAPIGGGASFDGALDGDLSVTGASQMDGNLNVDGSGTFTNGLFVPDGSGLVLTGNAELTVAGNVGFFGHASAAQPSSTGQTAGQVSGVGTAVLVDDTFTGGTGTKAYTVGDIVKALKSLGLLASS